MSRTTRAELLRRALKERILVLDGATGTAMQAFPLKAEDFGGPDYEGCNENLVQTRPDVVQDVHESYLEVGADILETNTFGGTPLVLAEYGLAEKTYELNRKAAEIAAEAAGRYSKDKIRFVAGSMGPTTKAITVTGGVTFDELGEHYKRQAEGLYDGAVDYFLLETCQDTRNVKAALLGLERLYSDGREKIPLAVSCTIEASGTMLAGQTIDAFWASLAHLDLLYIGLNCATGPAFMTDHVRTLSGLARTSVACVPNAGLPDENGKYLETPDMMASVLGRFLYEKWVNVIGGCCGTTAPHIERFTKLAHDAVPRTPATRSFSYLSGVDFVEVAEELRPLLVGERTNVIGSRKFKKLISSGEFDAAAEIARGQVKNGAQVVDVCLANPDRNEFTDMEAFLEKAIRMVRVPFMIDSTDEKVIERALTFCQGKAIVNSVNLEDGEERFDRVVPLVKCFGAALVVGTIDDDPEQGMAVTRERKLHVAQRAHELLVQKWNFPEEDIYFDALVFPCGTGDAQYIGSAVETIEGVRLIKSAFPKCRTVLGISNVSFGLPESGREVLNAVFLYHCTLAGLDMAIVNTQQLKRYPSIPANERTLAEDLLWNRGSDPVATFAAHFRQKKSETKPIAAALPLDERLARYILEGSKDGLIPDLDLALKDRTPLEVINGPLMKGMDEVGRLFNANELIVAEVLQSAEAMKAAVSYLERFMEKKESALRGKVILATVKGDVHDIGKNLVEIILANNGFEVVNLGIKVAPETLIAAAREHSPQILGLSGLLVKSAHQMVATAEDLSKAGVKTPLLVGGAALSRSFVDRRIAKAYTEGTVEYATDAMNGLELAKIMVDPQQFETLKTKLADRRSQLPASSAETLTPLEERPSRSKIQPVSTPYAPPDFDRHILTKTPIEELWKFINPKMLFGRHLGLPNSLVRLLEEGMPSELNETEGAEKAQEIQREVNAVKKIVLEKNLLQPKAVYQFVRAVSNDREIRFGAEKNFRIQFPRQAKAPFLCIADFLNTRDDNVCFLVVTAGHGVREEAQKWKEKGDYLRSHILSALALETAEGYAEWLHKKIRGMWGTHDKGDLTMPELFQGHYQGRRYSFGYPACPDLEGQHVLFDILKPQEIGVDLTEGFMMDPEASVSAIVFYHPEATYFST